MQHTSNKTWVYTWVIHEYVLGVSMGVIMGEYLGVIMGEYLGDLGVTYVPICNE